MLFPDVAVEPGYGATCDRNAGDGLAAKLRTAERDRMLAEVDVTHHFNGRIRRLPQDLLPLGLYESHVRP